MCPSLSVVKAHLTGKDPKMKQLFGYLFVSLLAGLWLSLKEATCFTAFLDDNSRPLRKPLEEASQGCKESVPGSSLIVINNKLIQRTVEGFIRRQLLENETIIMDARMVAVTESQKWSWVNGHPYSPDVSRDARNTSEQFYDGACVESKHGQSPAYCFGNATSVFGYICEHKGFSYRENNRYTTNEGPDTWYDARKKCLRSGVDLASITDLRTIENWPQLKESQNQRYWIGLHRNKWIWNSTGAALTYTNWENGFPDESSDKRCICFSPKCRREGERTVPKCEAENDRKWRTCSCNNSYAIVCQTEENILLSSSADFKSSVSLSAYTTTNLHRSSLLSSSSASSPTTAKATTLSTISTNSKSITTSIYSTAHSFPAKIAPTSKTIINTTPTVATTSKTTPPLKTVTPSVTTYATTPTKEVGKNTAPTSSMTEEPLRHFSEHQTTVFASSSPEQFNSFRPKEILLILLLFVAVIFIIVAVIVVIRKRKYNKRNEESIMENTNQSETVSSAYTTAVSVNRPSEVTIPPGNTIYAEVEMTRRPTPSNNIVCASVQITNVIYAEPNKPTKSSEPIGNAVKAVGPIYLEAIEVKPGAGSEVVATQDPSAVYAEPIKVKKSS